MKSCQQLVIFALVLILSTHSGCHSMPTAESNAEIQHRNDEAQFVVITEDVIPDIENKTQKVIRVNPLDLPPLRDDITPGNEDSSLYTIQSLLPPANRNYVNLRRPRPHKLQGGNMPSVRNYPEQKLQKPRQKKKHLHFLYDQEGLDGEVIGKRMRVHVAPGAYPVYYTVAKTNGRFGKFPIKSFRTQKEFMKYLMNAKAEAAAELEEEMEAES